MKEDRDTVFGARTAHNSRRFVCKWPARAESAYSIAERIQAFNRRLADVQPQYRELWPLLVARAIKPGRDPGPVLDMTAEELGEIVDRRTRDEPPRWPQRVSESGYRVLISAGKAPMNPLSLALTVHAGRYGTGPYWGGNSVEVDYHMENSIWLDLRRGEAVLHALVDCFEPDWACAYGSISCEYEGGLWRSTLYPWIAWARAGLTIDSHYVKAGGPPDEVRADRGGDLWLWR